MTSDRTEELIRAMLERRATEPPTWLADSAMRTIARAPQRRAGRPGSAGSIPWIGLVVAAGVLAVSLLGLTLGTRLLGGDRRPGPDPSAAAGVLVPPQSTAGMSSAAAASSAPPDSTPADEPVDDPAPPVLEPDSIAVVTDEGDRLRVRTKPGVGTDSKPLRPLLGAGTRMLVVDGPVEADGYEWYEVLVEQGAGLFGWVATGKDGAAWLSATAPECPDAEKWPLAVTDIESLACFGDRTLTIDAQISEGLGPLSEGMDAAGFACPDLAERGGCDIAEPWLRFAGDLLVTNESEDAYAWLAIPPGSPAGDVATRLGDNVALTGQWDAPEARDCRVVDPQTGADVVSRDEAITRCRVVFVVRSIERTP